MESDSHDPEEPPNCNSVNTTSQLEYLIPIYQIICPVMVSICAISFMGNLVILCTGFHVRKKQLNPTLMFSLSLAAADAVAAFALGTGIFVNNILEFLWKIQIEYCDCIIVLVEAFRLSAMVISALHFMVLGEYKVG